MSVHVRPLLMGCCLFVVSSSAAAQHDHAIILPTQPGQAAYGAIAEVVRMLEADATTDWSKVNVEALRQHLIDMDAVTMRSTATSRSIDGGISIDVTGSGSTVGAIKRMVTSHAAMLDSDDAYNASTSELANGVRLTVTARDKNNLETVAKIRGLGFAGLMTEGNHHAAHHLALASGKANPHGM